MILAVLYAFQARELLRLSQPDHGPCSGVVLDPEPMMSSLVLLAQTSSPGHDLDSQYQLMQGVFWVFGAAAVVFCVWMLIDALRREPTPAKKFGWALIILILPLAGALLYLFVRKGSAVRPAT
jgi:cytochrome bd-type quinol oxidase subunit 2